MKGCNVCWKAALGGFAIASAGIGVALHGWPNLISIDANDPAWMGAIATTIAAGVALYFGLSDVRHRWEERKRAVGVYQWLFMPDVARSWPALNSIEDFLDGINREGIGFEIPPSELAYMDELREEVSAKVINQHVDALVYMPKTIGQPLARIASNGSILSTRLAVIRANPVVTDRMKDYASQIEVLVKKIREDINDIGWLNEPAEPAA